MPTHWSGSYGWLTGQGADLPEWLTAEQARLILDFARLYARNRSPEEGGRLEIVLHELWRTRPV